MAGLLPSESHFTQGRSLPCRPRPKKQGGRTVVPAFLATARRRLRLFAGANVVGVEARRPPGPQPSREREGWKGVAPLAAGPQAQGQARFPARSRRKPGLKA